MSQARDHERAIMAHEHVSSVVASHARAYGALCHKLPILVHQAGLAPALHHAAALSKKEKGQLLDHLAEQLGSAGFIVQPDRNDLLRLVRGANLEETFTLTREVMRCLDWYKRFAKTVLQVDSTVDAGEE